MTAGRLVGVAVACLGFVLGCFVVFLNLVGNDEAPGDDDG